MNKKIFALLLALLLVISVGCTAEPTPQTPLTVVGTTAAAASSTVAPVHTTVVSSSTPDSTDTASSSEQVSSTTSATTAAAPQTSLSAATTYTTTSMQTIRYEDVEARFSVMTTEEKIGQLFFVSVEGRDALTEADQALLRDCSIGNIILFKRNIDNIAQLATLNTGILDAVSANTGICPFIGVDQEGGTVMRIFDACLAPPAMEVGATGDPALARSLGELMGAQLHTLGINVNFAPCADVNSNPDNPVIGDRSYSEDANTAAAFVSAMVAGLQSSGVLACVKHFPGHGDTAEDSHTSLPSVSYELDRLNQVELVPFRAGIAANVAMTMVGHILYPALGAYDVPASLSQSVIEGFLRDELDFKGLVITDSLSMGAITNTYGIGEACVMAITAGADLLCINDNADAIREAYAAVVQAVEDGRISEDRLNDSVLRILNTKYEYGILSGFRPSDQMPDTTKYAALLSTIAEKSLTLLEGQVPGISDVSSTLVLSTVPLRDEQVLETQNLGAYLTRNYGCNAMDIERSPTTIQLASALSTAKLYSTVILSVSGTGNIDLASRIAQLGADLIIVVMDDPYTAASYLGLGADAVFCAYENTDYSIRAVANRLMGADS
ncbi:MAG: glycoside hydrolase family 3 protein [Clostridiaceae bacterium]|nr:glycoside hydrolase family 3 protein [Clostridiaceae bacterium]